MSEATEQQTPPMNRAELVNELKNQLEIRTLQVELQELSTRLMRARAEELQAMAFIQNLTTPPSEEEEDQPAPTIPAERKLSRK